MASEPQKKQPVKGILKHTSSLDKTSKREVEWDEMNILATFHPPGKDYGHMKVDEPPTPYNKYSDAEEEEGGERRGSASNLHAVGLDPSLLASRLSQTEGEGSLHKSAHITEGDDATSEEDENETEEERAKRKAFELKRKLHYNEFAAVQLAKKLMSEEEEEEEDDEVDPKKLNTNPNASGFALSRSSEPATESMDSGTVDAMGGVPSDVNMACESGE